MEKRKNSKRSFWRPALPYIATLGLVLFAVIIILALMGPYIGHIYSNTGLISQVKFGLSGTE